MITVDDILDFLVSKSAAPSNFGYQLDRLKYGLKQDSDPFRSRDEVENNLMRQASLIRCLDAFTDRQEFIVTTSQRLRDKKPYRVLEKLSLSSKRGYGTIATGILRVYQERCTHSQERGLLEVYNYISQLAPLVVPSPPKTVTDLLEAFRKGEAKNARNMACEAYADSLLALANHVRIHNK